MKITLQGVSARHPAARRDAVAALRLGAGGLEITLRPALAAKFGYARSVSVGMAGCEDQDEALAALQEMMGDLWQEG